MSRDLCFFSIGFEIDFEGRIRRRPQVEHIELCAGKAGGAGPSVEGLG